VISVSVETIDLSLVTLKKYVIGSGEPKVVITAGLHGDEVTSIYAAFKVIRELESQKINGTVVIFPIANPLGFYARRRESPIDGVDINRVFPEGSGHKITRKIVENIWEEVKNADYALDLHCAGLQAFQYILALYEEFDYVKSFVANIPWEIVVESTGLRGQLFVEASHNGIPAAIVETVGGASYFSEEWAKNLKDTVIGLLSNLEILDFNKKKVNQIFLSRIERIKSPKEGFFVHKAHPGDTIREGDVIGYIDTTTNGELIEIKSPIDGVVISLNSYRYVSEGDSIAGVAKLKK